MTPLSSELARFPAHVRWREDIPTAHERRILVLAPISNDARVTAEVLEAANLTAVVVRSCDELCARMVEGCGAIMIAEEVLQGKGVQSLFALLGQQPTWSDLPVILITSRNSGGETESIQRFSYVTANARATILERPFRPATLTSALEVALRNRGRQYQVRRLLKELGEARDTAEAASRAKDDFLAALSHELRTPLNPVLLISSDGARDETLPEGVRRDFELIVRNIELEARLIEDLLDLTRVVRGKMTLEVQTVEVHDAIQEAVQTLVPEIAAKKISIHTDLQAERSAVNADPVRLQQVLWNVLKNAIKFTPDSGQIRIRTQNRSDFVCIQISDTGVGMSQEELTSIFEAFAQGDHARPGSGRRYGGLGLGLAITKHLITLHGGAIDASSPGPGRGSTFTITLPARPEIDGEAALDGQASTASLGLRSSPVIVPARPSASA